MTPRTVLITGAGGFVGGSLVRGFADLGWKVTAVDREFDDGWKDPTVEWVQADLAEGVPSDFTSVDVVIHAAWISTGPEVLGISSAEYTALNARPFDAVLEFVESSQPASFVFVSSSGVFAPSDGTDALTDDLNPTADSPYATGKRTSELYLEVEAEMGALAPTKLHVLRLGHMYGPGERIRPSRTRRSLVAEWIAAAQAGRPLEVRSDNPLRDWTYAPDLARAFRLVVDGPSDGRPRHVGCDRVISDEDLAGLVSSHYSGAEITTIPPLAPVKPPMVPSALAALNDFTWTPPQDGVAALVQREQVT